MFRFSYFFRFIWAAQILTRSEPPIPMFTTSVIFFPVYPTHFPPMISLQNCSIWLKTRETSVMTFFPSKFIGKSSGLARKATCNTARFSVLLILPAENISSRFSSTLRDFAKFNKSFRMSSLIRFLEKSRRSGAPPSGSGNSSSRLRRKKVVEMLHYLFMSQFTLSFAHGTNGSL